jgi:hypothetical protein
MISRGEEALLRKIALAIWSVTKSPVRLLDEVSRPDSELARQQLQCWTAARAVFNALAGIES